MAKKSSIVAELRRRKAEAEREAAKPIFDLSQFCFGKQTDFVLDQSKFKTAVCSRRAGKTFGIAADMIYTASEEENVNVLYITLNRLSAKRIIWKDLLRINKEYELDGAVNTSELTITFPKGGMIYVSGAKDESEIEKFRGMALRKVFIDEAQSFRPYLQALIDDVLVPALYDYDGPITLIGTPGPICTGAFYEAAHNPEWSHHTWTILDNPWIERKSGKPPQLLLDEERKRRGISADDPTYQRESLGRWVQDLDALVYKFNVKENVYHSKPRDGTWTYIFGIDIGYNDADAIAVLGYNSKQKRVYLVEEKITRKQDITSLVKQVKILKDKYDPVKMVMDAGALGKKIQEEIQIRHSLLLEAAEKVRKVEFIELLNDDMRTGKFKAKAQSRFEQDCYLVQWDMDSKAKNPEKPKISDAYHSDITDAVLYAWRECRHYLHEKEEPSPHRNTDAYMKNMEREEAAKLKEKQDAKWWEPDPEETDALFDSFDRDLDEFDW